MPVPLSSLLGRDAELADLTAMLRRRDVRLLTLSGAGGVGKTRLALELANRVRDTFAGGHYYIQLGRIQQPEHVVPAILRVLRDHRAPGATSMTELADGLGTKRTLVLLNSVDRVIDARADIVSLLEQLPNVTTTVTSRIPLRVRGEHEYPIASLPVPHKGMTLDQLRRIPSVELLLERARAVRPTFQLDEQNANDIVEILQLLDGLPFAIELVALRTRLFPVRVIRERMENLLDFLSGAPHDLPPRLHSMRGALQWSYEMLDPCGQKVFRALSIFSSPFSFEAALHILRDKGGGPAPVGDVMDVLAQMVDHSFVVPKALATGDAGYWMPETIRAFGREKLVENGERDEVLAREIAFYRRSLETHAHEIYGPKQPSLVARLDQHVDNLIEALNAARRDSDRTEDALRVATLLVPYWLLRGKVQEGTEYLETFKALAVDIPDNVHADACRALGSLYLELCRFEQAREQHQCAMHLYENIGDEKGTMDSANNLGVVSMKIGDIDRARVLLTRALESRRSAGDLNLLAETLDNLGDLAIHDGDVDRAVGLYTESYQLHVGMENPVRIVSNCVNLLTVALLDYQYEGPTEEWYLIGLENAAKIDDRLGRAQLHVTYALLQTRQEPKRAAQHLGGIAPSLRDILASESRRVMVETLPIAAGVCAYLGDDRVAAQVLGTSSTIMGRDYRFAWYRGRKQVERLVEYIRHKLGEGEFTRFTTLGSYQTVLQAIEAVIELVERAGPEDAPSDEDPAPETAAEAVQLTGREKEVLSLVAQGLSDKDIAGKLGISPRTAMTHVSNIMAKMKVHSRSAASDYGIRMGVVEAPREA